MHEYLYNKHLVMLVIISIALFLGLFRLGSQPLIDSDEATYARVFQESVERGDFLSFTKRGEPWLEKPPLYFWLMTASGFFLGENEFSFRLPSALLAAATVLLIYLIALQLTQNRLAAALSAFILLTIGAFWDAGRQVRMDVPVTFFILFSVYCFLRGFKNPRWFLGFGIGIALGVLTKSVIGLLPIPIILLVSLVYRKWGWFQDQWLWLGAALFFVIAVPWHIYEYKQFGREFLETYFGYHIFQRFAKPILGGSNNNFFYFKNLFAQTQPWLIVFAIAAIGFLIKIIKNSKSLLNHKLALLSLLSAVFILLVFAAAKTKLFYYLVPTYPFLALFLAAVLAPLFKSKAFIALLVILFIIGGTTTALQNFFPATFYSITLPKGVVDKYSLAADEKAIGEILEDDRSPVYLYNWIYRDTLTYYGDAPELLTWNKTALPPAGPSFLLIPNAFFNSNFQESENLQIIHKGRVGTLLKYY